MVNPQKVLNFLDVFGTWDASLILVMLGAIAVYAAGYFFWLPKTNRPILAEKFDLPTKKAIDSRLILGAILFGIGWGVAGICPGPAIANITSGNIKILAFLAMMLIGMKAAKLLERRKIERYSK